MIKWIITSSILAWSAAVLSRNDAELACDEATIKRLGENERAEYGRTLIGMTCEKRPALLLTATTMTGSKSGITDRIMLISKKSKTAVYTLIAVVLISAIAAGCTFTGTNAEDDPWAWAQGIDAGSITAAVPWDNTGDMAKLTDAEIEKLASLLNSLNRDNFTENTELAGGTPTYGLQIETAGTTYNINESIAPTGALEMNYAGRQWWINSDKLASFIKQVTKESDEGLEISEDIDESIPDAVIDYATDFTETQLSYYTDELGDEITEAKITDLTHINTGTAGLDDGINMYLLEYRFLAADPDEVSLAGGMRMEDGYITEWGSTGQPYLLLRWDDSGDTTSCERICATNTDIIEQDYGTPEMLEQYGNAYTAAAMELYDKYLNTYILNNVSIVLEPGFTIREDAYRCFINDDGILVGVELVDRDSERLLDFVPGYDESFDPFSLPTDVYGNHYRDYVFEGEYHYIVYREYEQGVVIVNLMCPEYEGYSESLNENYKSRFPLWAASATPASQNTAEQQPH